MYGFRQTLFEEHMGPLVPDFARPEAAECMVEVGLGFFLRV